MAPTRGKAELDHGCYPGLHTLWLDGQILEQAPTLRHAILDCGSPTLSPAAKLDL